MDDYTSRYLARRQARQQEQQGGDFSAQYLERRSAREAQQPEETGRPAAAGSAPAGPTVSAAAPKVPAAPEPAGGTDRAAERRQAAMAAVPSLIGRDVRPWEVAAYMTESRYQDEEMVQDRLKRLAEELAGAEEAQRMLSAPDGEQAFTGWRSGGKFYSSGEEAADAVRRLEQSYKGVSERLLAMQAQARRQAEQERLASLDIQGEKADLAFIEARLNAPSPQGMTIQQARDLAERAGQLRADIAGAEKIARGKAYEALRQSPDFSRNSGYVSTYRGGERFNAFTGMYANTGFEDITYDYINGNEDARERYTANAVGSGAAGLGLDKGFLATMTEDEVALFNYLYATKGAEDAYGYVQHLQGDLTARQRAKESAAWAAEARRHPVAMSAFSVLESPLKGLAYLGQAADYAADGTIDQNAGYNKFSYMNSAVRGQVAEIAEQKWGEPGSFLYQTGMSMGDFLFNTAITGGFNGGIDKELTRISANLSLAIMGAGAAADATIEAKDRGLSDGQALTLGTIAGAAEVVTERVSIETLLNATSLGKNAVGYLLQNVLAEGSEEVGADVINLFADVMIAKDKSKWQTAINEYQALGMDEKDAFWRAVRDQAEQMGLDFLGGALSGGVMAGGAIGIHAAGSYLDSRQAGARTETANAAGARVDSPIDRVYQVIGEQSGQPGRVTNRQAEAVLADQAAVDALEQMFGLQLKEGMTQSQRRAAVKDAVARMLAAQGAEQADLAERQTGPQTAKTAREAADGLPESLRGPAEALGESGRRALASAYQGEDTASFYAGFAAVYQAGLSGRGMENIQNEYAGQLSEAARYAAYAAGENDAKLSLEREQRAAKFAKSAGTESGLVWDSYVETLDPRTAERIHDVAQRLGVRVRFAESAGLDAANANIDGSEILVSKDTSRGELFVLGHEWTHRMQEAAPAEYRQFRDFLGEALEGQVPKLMEIYAEHGLSLSYEQALDEAAANYAGELLEDGQLLDEFIRRHRDNRNLLERVRDAIRAIWQKIRGGDRHLTEMTKGAVDRLNAALDAAAGAVETMETTAETENAAQEGGGEMKKSDAAISTTPSPGTGRSTASGFDNSITQDGGDGKTRFSLKTFEDGKRFVDVEADQEQFDGLSPREQGRLATQVIKKRFLGRVIGLDNPVYVNSRTAGEYGFPLKRADPAALEAKMRASTELDNLIDAGTNFRTAPDGRDGHVHPDSVGDFQYFDTIFKVGGEYYTGVINIMQTANGLVLKDITKIRNITQDICSSYGPSPKSAFLRDASMGSIAQDGRDGKAKKRNTTQDISGSYGVDPQATFLRDASMGSIAQDGGDGKTKFSLKGSEDALDYATLEKENARLRRRVDYLQGQMRQTRPGGETLRSGDITKLAGRLLRAYDSRLQAKDISGPLQALGEHILRTEELSMADLRERALPVAKTIVENALTVDDEMYRQYSELRSYLRDTKLHVPRSMWADLESVGGYDGFRRANMGRLQLSSTGGTGIDVAFAELAERYPEFFSEDISASPAEQLTRLADVLEGLRPIYENPHSAQMDIAVQYAVNDILDGLLGEEVRQAPATYADRQATRLQEERAKGRRAVERTRQQRDQAVQRLKDHYQEVRQRQSARRADSKARQQLLKIAKRLQDKKLPAVSRALLDQYIGDLDTAAVSMTGKKLQDLTALQEWYSDQKRSDPDFIADPHIEEALSRLGKRHIGDMTTQEVAELTEVLLHIENELRTKNKLIDEADRRDIYHMGEEVIGNIEASGGTRGGLGDFIATEVLSPVRQLRRYTGYAQGDPLVRAARSLADGQREMLDYQMRSERLFQRFTADKAFSAFSGKKAQGIQIAGMTERGVQTVTISPAMRASLYLHSLNDQNLRHIRDGGITVPNWKLYQRGDLAEAYSRGVTLKLTPSQVRAITAGMTAQEKQFAQAAHRYFNEVSREAINSVSERLKGYSLAQVEDYFPINTDRNFTRAEFESIKYDGTIEGMGMLKERQAKASNPIYLRDINAVVEQSIQQHSRYVGLAIPVRNFNKLWQVSTSQVDSEGKRVSYTGGVRQAMERAWGKNGSRYVEKLMTDLQSGPPERGTVAKVLAKLRSNYAAAVLTVNASVAMKQAASYPTAAAVLGGTPLAQAMTDVGKVDTGLIAKYTPLLWYRSKGFSTRELGDLRKAGKGLPKVLNWVQGVDVLTTEKLWKASEYYVRENSPVLRQGSDAYYRAVADIYNRVIEETQPNYTTMQQGQMLRSGNDLVASLSMFKTQPFQNTGILIDAAGELAARVREERAGRGDRKALAEAKRNFGRAVTSQAAQLAVFAGMTMAWAMFRGKRDKYENGEGEMTLPSVLTALGKDMAGGAMAGIPFGSDAWEVLSSRVFGDTYYGMEAVTVSALKDTIEAFNGLADLMEESVRTIAAGESVDWNAARLELDGCLDKASKAVGVPYENVANLFSASCRQVCIAALGKYQGEYAVLKLTADPKSETGKYCAILWDCLKAGEIEDYEAIGADLQELSGLDGEAIRKRMKALYDKAVKEGRPPELSQRAMDLIGVVEKSGEQEDSTGKSGAGDLDAAAYRRYNGQRADTYREILDALAGYDSYAGLDGRTRDALSGAAAKLAAETALAGETGGETETKWVQWATGGQAYGVDESEAILFRAAYGMSESDKDPETGRTVPGSKKQNTLELAEEWMPWLTDEELRYLMSGFWTEKK